MIIIIMHDSPHLPGRYKKQPLRDLPSRVRPKCVTVHRETEAYPHRWIVRTQNPIEAIIERANRTVRDWGVDIEVIDHDGTTTYLKAEHPPGTE